MGTHFWVKLKDKPGTTRRITEEQFDENTMERFTEEEEAVSKIKAEFNMKEMIKSRTPPGLPGKDTRGNSMYYKGKLDEGATKEFLDRNLGAAKQRAGDRNKKGGASFRHMKRLKRRKK